MGWDESGRLITLPTWVASWRLSHHVIINTTSITSRILADPQATLNTYGSIFTSSYPSLGSMNDSGQWMARARMALLGSVRHGYEDDATLCTTKVISYANLSFNMTLDTSKS